MGIIHYFFEHNGIILSLYGLYTFLVFAHATLLTRNISIGALGSSYNLCADVFLWLWFSGVLIKTECFQKRAQRCFSETFSLQY
jgi:uncharacterized membrane protein YeiB